MARFLARSAAWAFEIEIGERVVRVAPGFEGAAARDAGVAVLSLPPSVRIFLARDPVDCRKAFDGLCQVVRDVFGDDPFSGALFLFLNRRRNRVTVLVWDENGFWLFAKR